MFKKIFGGEAAANGASILAKYNSFFEFSAVDIHGESQEFSKYKGLVTLTVNVASKWGLTKTNYEQLQQINQKYYDQGLRILGFPCNQFGGQEPGTDAEVLEFTKQFGVTFDMFHKVDVNGDTASPLFKWLKERLTGTLTNSIKWNFTKFLCDRNGKPYKRFGPKTNPNDLIPDIETLLSQSESE